MDDVDKKIEEMVKDYKPSKSKKFYIALLSIMSVLAIALAITIIVLLTFR